MAAIGATRETSDAPDFRARVNRKMQGLSQSKAVKAAVTGAKAVTNISPSISLYALKFGIIPHNLFLQNPNMGRSMALLEFGFATAASISIYALMNKEQVKIILGKG
jgi:hypothetical protein